MEIDKFKGLSKEDFDKICRTCLDENGLIPILHVNLDEISLQHVISYCASIQVKFDDELPKNICKACLIKFNATFRFLKTCKDSEDTLNDVIFKSNKNETSDMSSVKGEFEDDAEDCVHESLIIRNSTELNDSKELIENKTQIINDNHSVKSEQIKDDVHCVDKSHDIQNSTEFNDKVLTPKKEINSTIRKINKSQLVSEKDAPKAKRTYISSFKGPPFTCVVCSESFQEYQSFKTHRIEFKHLKPKKFICPHCSRPHVSNSKLQEHIRTHTGEKPNQCPICDRRFNFKVDLRRHITVVHSDKKPYSCRICHKGFTRKQYTLDHERLHTGDALMCTCCGKSFFSISALSKHEKTHKHPGLDLVAKQDTDKSFRCELCDKVLLYEHTLKSHILLHGPRNFSCDKCGKTFTSKSRVRKHIQFSHLEVENPCEVCGKIYKSKSGLSMHMKSHTGENSYDCEFCNKHFTFKNSLNQHMRLHTGDTRFQCFKCQNICLNKRQLENHMRVHTGEKLFKCSYCGKAFSLKARLTAHVSTIHTNKEETQKL